MLNIIIEEIYLCSITTNNNPYNDKQILNRNEGINMFKTNT